MPLGASPLDSQKWGNDGKALPREEERRGRAWIERWDQVCLVSIYSSNLLDICVRPRGWGQNVIKYKSFPHRHPYLWVNWIRKSDIKFSKTDAVSSFIQFLKMFEDLYNKMFKNMYCRAFPVGPLVRSPPANAEGTGSILVWELRSHIQPGNWAHAPQQEKPLQWEACAQPRRKAPTAATRDSLHNSEGPAQPIINKYIF